MDHLNRESKISKTIKKVALVLFALAVLLPVSIVVMASFKKMADLFENPLGIPKQISFSNYTHMFQETGLTQYFMNSILVTAVTVISILFFSSMLSYAIYRLTGWIGVVLYGLFAAGMMVPAQVNMIPIYALISELKLINTHTGLIAVSIAVFLPVAVFILSGFMKTMPGEMVEAASIDGANEWKVYYKIVLPICMPSIAAAAIFLCVMVWNDLLFPLLLINSDGKKTMPLALLQFQGEFMTNFPMIFAGVIIASAPMVIAYVMLQKYFVEGVTAGSVKG